MLKINGRKFTLELLLLLIAFILAVGIRFYNLGKAPLSDSEAELALQALQFSKQNLGEYQSSLSPNISYIVLTGTLFTIFGSSNFLARLWPALAGSLLVFFPLLYANYFRKENYPNPELIRWVVIIITFGVALSPGLATVSRQAGSPMMALAFSILAIGFWINDRPVLAGISTGLGLISGPDFIIGAVGIVLALLFIWLLRKIFVQSSDEREVVLLQDSTDDKAKGKNSTPNKYKEALKLLLISMVSSIILISTFFMFFPQGLGAWIESIPKYLSGWSIIPDVPIATMVFGLLIYEIFAVLFALISIIRILTSPDSIPINFRWIIIFLITWIILGLTTTLLYPGREVQDLVWLLIPLWSLAAVELSILILKRLINIISIIEGIFILILSGLLWYTMASLSKIPIGASGSGVQIAISLGILALSALTIALVAFGWSWEVSRTGLVVGISAALFLYTFSVMWSSAHTRQNQPQELWGPQRNPGQNELVTKALSEMSSWNSGLSNYIDGISLVDVPSIRWGLRNFPEIKFINQPDHDALPSIIITHENENLPSLTASYRGEDFVWWSSAYWGGLRLQDYLRWFAYRELPLINEKIILWSRSDLYTSGMETINPAPPINTSPSTNNNETIDDYFIQDNDHDSK